MDNTVRHLMLIATASVFGIIIMGVVTEFWDLYQLSERGVTVSGEVISSEDGPRGLAVVRVTLDSTLPFNVSLPCAGISCEIGSQIPVTLLPQDPTVLVGGDFKEKFQFALFSTFLIGPIFSGFGTAYSLRKLTKINEAYTTGWRWRYFIPVFMSLGVMLSTVSIFILGGALSRFQVIATICLMIASFFYLILLKKNKSFKGIHYQVLAAVFFSLGVILIIMDFV